MSATYCWSCSECLCHESNFVKKDETVFPDLQYFEELPSTHPLHHVVKVLKYHPSYLRSFVDAFNFIMYADGPLTLNYKIYIAIMASSRHGCSDLVTSLSEEFSEAAYEDKDVWLLGLKMSPQKLQHLDEINRLLAHQPWHLTPRHIQELTQTSSSNWTMTELTQAIVILAFFHSLSSLLCSCGIGVEQLQLRKNSFSIKKRHKPSQDFEGVEASCKSEGHECKKKVTIQDDKDSKPNNDLYREFSEQEANGIEALLQKMSMVEVDEDVSPEEKLERFNRVERQSAKLVLSERGGTLKSLQESNHLQYSNQLDFSYEDFANHMSGTSQPFTLLDFNWGFHGFSVASLYYQGLGEVLDEKFELAKKLTYNTIGTKSNIDTTLFRKAIWMYVQCLYGLMDDSYNYDIINNLLEQSLRSYIKLVTCFPENVTRESYDSFMVGFLPSEKVHVNVMIQEARFEAELLYGLRAISDYRNQICT